MRERQTRFAAVAAAAKSLQLWFSNMYTWGNLENSAVDTGLEKASFHSNPKERQCQRMLKRPHNCTHLTHQQSNAQNSPSKALTVHKPRNSRRPSWI